MDDQRDVSGSTWRKPVLVVGFLAMAGSVVAAYTSPATGYELSIYAATPPAFWIGVTVAFAASLVVALTGERSLRLLALVLGGQATAAVVGLPLLRSYRFYGIADAMTHLGLVRDLLSGTSTGGELLYPGLHSIAVLVSETARVSPERSVLLVVFLLFVVTLVFVPLTVRAISGSTDATVIGAFAAFLLLPITTISTHPHAHPFTQATLFTAVLLYLFVRYVRQPAESGRSIAGFDPTAIGALLALAGAAIVLYHPQQSANVLIVFAAVSLVQLGYRRRAPAHPISRHRTMYAQTGFLAVVFALWSGRFGIVQTALSGIVETIIGYVVGTPPTAAEAVQSQGASLAAIGVSIHEFFLKLFLVSSIFGLFAGVLILGSLLGWLDDAYPQRNALVKYLSVGFVAIVPLFIVYTLGGISEQYFRHFGFMMLLVTVLGALALARWYDGANRWFTASLGLAFAAMLTLSLVTVFPSPYIYLPSQHVSDGQLDGYETVFEVQDDEVPLVGVRQGPWRYSDGIHGVATSREYRRDMPDGGLAELPAIADGPWNVVVTRLDREREVDAYRELRYSERGFRSLNTTRGVSRVVANGEVYLYYVEPSNRTASTNASAAHG